MLSLLIDTVSTTCEYLHMRKVVCERCSKIVFRKERSDAKYRFCSSRCALYEAVEKSKLVDRSGEKNPAWKGGVRYALGYKFILKKDHPMANDKGYVQEHRLIMEKLIGRYLLPSEFVHHINGIKDDNRPENLLLLSSQSEHIKIHLQNGSINTRFWLGKKFSPKTRLKMSLTHKNIWKNRKSQLLALQ